MKKALSVILSLVMVFSMFGVVAMAAEGDATPAKIHVVFKDSDGTLLKEAYVAPEQNPNTYAPENPAKADTDSTRYTFKGWQDGEGTIHPGSSALPTLSGANLEVEYVAVYSEEDISENQTLLSFIASIFERINQIFEYFVKVFEGVFDSVG